MTDLVHITLQSDQRKAAPELADFLTIVVDRCPRQVQLLRRFCLEGVNACFALPIEVVAGEDPAGGIDDHH